MELLIPAVATVMIALVAFGAPSLAFIAVKFFKLKERELTLVSESRQKSEHRQDAVEQRVQRLEEVLAELDRDVRERLGIERPAAATTPSRTELFEGPPAAAESASDVVRPLRDKSR